MDWHRITDKCEYVSVGESLIGIYHLAGNSVVLMDAGAVESPEFVEELAARGLEVKALLLSHLHFDHISTAGLLYERFRMPCYAHYLQQKEKEFPTRDFPVTPIRELCPIEIEGEKFEILWLPGHCRGHLGFVTPDGVCCVGDAFMSEKPLRAAKIPFFDDVETALATMEQLRETNYRAYLLCHEAVILPGELDKIIDLNIDKDLVLCERLRALVTGPVPIEELVTQFMKHCGIRSEFIFNFAPYRGTVKSRIMALENAGLLKVEGQWVTASE